MGPTTKDWYLSKREREREKDVMMDTDIGVMQLRAK